MHNFFKKLFSTAVVLACLQMPQLFSDLTAQDFVKTQNEEEALFFRRMVEFWEDHKTDLVKNEIENYIKSDKKGEFSDYLKALLGNVYFSEKQYKEATLSYDKIESVEIKEKILMNFLQAYWELKEFTSVVQKSLEFMSFIAASDKADGARYYFLIADSYYQLALNSPNEVEALGYAAKGRPYFEKISEENAELKPALGHLLWMLKEYRLAAEVYLEAADKLKEQKEHLLFQAATIQVNFDKEKAIETFSQICQVGKEKVKEAAFNKMVLLAELGRYNDLLLAKEQLEVLLDTDKKEKLHFLLGKAYLALGDYKRSGEELSAFLESVQLPSEEGKIAISMLLTGGEKGEEVASLNLGLAKLEQSYPDEVSLPAVYFVRALVHKKQENLEGAKKDFELIEKKYPEFALKEDFLLEAGAFYYQINAFLHSRLVFKTFVDKYKEHALLPLAWRYFINSSIRLLDLTPPEKLASARSVLSEDLATFLSEKGLCNETERAEYGLILAKTIYELENFDEAFFHLNYLFEHYPDLKEKAEAQLLMGALKKRQDKNDLSFLEHLEKALLLDTEKKLNQVQVRLNLFNSYLELSLKEGKYLPLAAEHLYQAQKDRSVQLLTDNLLWLSDYYYQKVEEHLADNLQNKLKAVKTEYEKANEVLDRMIDEYYADRNIPQEKLFLEEVLFKKAMLLGYDNDESRQKEFLLQLVGNYEKAPKAAWANKEKVYFELAKLNLDQNTLRALDYFEKVITINENSFFGLASKLAKVRLKLAKINKSELNVENPVIYDDLNTLRNIKLQKSVKNEPLHLEASLDYIELETAALPEKEQCLKRFELLKKMKEDFTSEEDVLSKDYQSSLKLFPSKARLVSAYLALVDAEMALMQAKAKGNQKELFDRAEALYRQMMEDKLLLTHYLDGRVQTALLEIKEYKRSLLEPAVLPAEIPEEKASLEDVVDLTQTSK
ncbi:MAG: hypothetical protein WC371_04225 [Parachlamydiales bacterium]|jgi:hypothetical protein